ncbi:hypothetical protein P692DRAFT_20835423 [Suillus brevipes Sb2]|nr:hypothetical protein P692DRAFT_20835423 [Suillus brevipes Sb2]
MNSNIHHSRYYGEKIQRRAQLGCGVQNQNRMVGLIRGVYQTCPKLSMNATSFRGPLYRPFTQHRRAALVYSQTSHASSMKDLEDLRRLNSPPFPISARPFISLSMFSLFDIACCATLVFYFTNDWTGATYVGATQR